MRQEKQKEQMLTEKRRTDAEITRLKDGRTRLAYKAEHTVDMETGAVLAAEILPATTADGESILTSIDKANENISEVRRDDDDADDDDDDDGDGGCSVEVDTIEEVVGDKGYHKASTIQRFAEEGVRTYIPERKLNHRRRWRDGGRNTAVAVYQNRARVKRKKSKAYQRRRGELLERTFAHVCETGAHRRTRLRGRENVAKRYLIQVAAFNLSLVMRKLFGRGTPRGLVAAFEHLIALLALHIRAGHRAVLRTREIRANPSLSAPLFDPAGAPVCSTGC